MHIMLDLETLSTAPDAAIVAIGAVTARIPAERYGSDSFYRIVDGQSSIKAGGSMSFSTWKWWMDQSKEAQSIFNDPRAISIEQALSDFDDWLDYLIPADGSDDALVWGNGSDFDNVVIRGAYERLGRKAPWSFRNNRCYRTLKNLAPEIRFEQPGTAHNALDDATAQANHLERIWKHLNL